MNNPPTITVAIITTTTQTPSKIRGMTSSCRGGGNLAGVWLTAPPTNTTIPVSFIWQTLLLLLLQMGQVCMCQGFGVTAGRCRRTKFWVERWTRQAKDSIKDFRECVLSFPLFLWLSESVNHQAKEDWFFLTKIRRMPILSFSCD